MHSSETFAKFRIVDFRQLGLESFLMMQSLRSKIDRFITSWEFALILKVSEDHKPLSAVAIAVWNISLL